MKRSGRGCLPGCRTGLLLGSVGLVIHRSRCRHHRIDIRRAERYLCTLAGIKSSTTTACHPQSNGMAEQAHCQLKDSLRSRLAAEDWPFHLPWVLLAIWAVPKEASGVSSAELVFGSSPTLPDELVGGSEKAAAEVFVQRLQRQQMPPTRKM